MKHYIWLMTIIFMMGCSSTPKRSVTIESVGNTMAYDITTVTVESGTNLTIIFKNNATLDVMKHNIVILDDSTAINEVGIAAINAPNYVPDHPAIIAYSDLIGPGEVTQVTFTVPTEPGKYPFVCTFPGHYSMMQGVIVVQ